MTAAAVELDHDPRPTRRLAAVPVDRITEQARGVEIGRTLLTVIAAVLYGLGWAAAKVFSTVWLALCWCAVAVKVGWQDATVGSGGDGS